MANLQKLLDNLHQVIRTYYAYTSGENVDDIHESMHDLMMTIESSSLTRKHELIHLLRLCSRLEGSLNERNPEMRVAAVEAIFDFCHLFCATTHAGYVRAGFSKLGIVNSDPYLKTLILDNILKTHDMNQLIDVCHLPNDRDHMLAVTRGVFAKLKLNHSREAMSFLLTKDPDFKIMMLFCFNQFIRRHGNKPQLAPETMRRLYGINRLELSLGLQQHFSYDFVTFLDLIQFAQHTTSIHVIEPALVEAYHNLINSQVKAGDKDAQLTEALKLTY